MIFPNHSPSLKEEPATSALKVLSSIYQEMPLPFYAPVWSLPGKSKKSLGKKFALSLQVSKSDGARARDILTTNLRLRFIGWNHQSHWINTDLTLSIFIILSLLIKAIPISCISKITILSLGNLFTLSTARLIRKITGKF